MKKKEDAVSLGSTLTTRGNLFLLDRKPRKKGQGSKARRLEILTKIQGLHIKTEGTQETCLRVGKLSQNSHASRSHNHNGNGYRLFQPGHRSQC